MFYSQCNVHHEFIPEGQTVNKEIYADMFCCLRDVTEGNIQKNGEQTVVSSVMIMLQILVLILEYKKLLYKV